MRTREFVSLLSLIFLFVLSGCGENATTADEAAESDVVTSSSAPPSKRALEVGEAVEIPGVVLTVNSVTQSDQLMLYSEGSARGSEPSEQRNAASGEKFVSVDTTVKNLSSEPWDLSCGHVLQTWLLEDELDDQQGDQEKKFSPIVDLDQISGNPECGALLEVGAEIEMTWSFAIPDDIEITHFGFSLSDSTYNDLAIISLGGAIETSSAVTTSEVAAPENFADPLPEITPVDCQVGLGPIITTWSDGTVGGWSQHCQDVHDEVLAGEVAANTPVCDGVVCTYPSGATMPDPNAPQIPSDTSGAVCDENQCVYPNGYIARIGDPNVPNYLKPGNSPWVQGQIDFQNCLDSGKTIEQCREELN